MSSNPRPDGYVYFFHSPVTGQTKIGQSRHPGSRLYEISRHVPKLECVCNIGTDDPRWLERVFHDAFAEKREQGEWFALTPDDISLVQTSPDYIADHTDFPPGLWLLVNTTGIRGAATSERGAIPYHVSPRFAAMLASLELLTAEVAGGDRRGVEQIMGEALDAVLLAEVEKRIGVVEPEVQVAIRDLLASVSHAPIPAEESEVEEAA